ADGEPADEVGDVGTRDAPSALGLDLHGAGHGDDPFSAVARDVVVDPALDRLQERRLSVITSADDQGHAGGDPHARDRPGVRRLEGDAELGWRYERMGPVG